MSAPPPDSQHQHRHHDKEGLELFKPDNWDEMDVGNCLHEAEDGEQDVHGPGAAAGALPPEDQPDGRHDREGGEGAAQLPGRGAAGGHAAAAVHGMLSPSGSNHGNSVSPQELLRNFVQIGSKEYKHEFKKARDRLYKRKLRVLRTQGIMDNSAARDIPLADIEAEMLSRYTANKTVQAGMEKRDTESADTSETAETVPEPSSEGGVMYEVRVETEDSVLLEDLELRLDNVVPGEGAAGGQEGAAQLLGGGAAGGQGAAAVLGQEGAAQLLGGGAAGGQGAAVRSSPAATCEVCGEHFEQKQQLYDHRKKHKQWCCKKCGKTIAGTVSLKLHKLHCSKDVPQYQCQICNYTSVSKTNFNRHLKTQHTVSPTKLHSCHVCDFETEAKMLLRKHLRTHTSRPKYECERCKRKFVNKEKFEQHVADHEKVTIRTSTGDYFKLEPRLGKNNRVQKFYCNCCDYSTPRMFDLKRHKWRKHERHHKCPETTENQIDIEDIIEMCCITGISFRDVVKINRIVRRKFGKKAVEPNMTRKLRRMISNMGAWFETKKIIVKKKKKYIETYVSYVKDLNGFIKWIIEGRGYSDPQVSFSGDGGGSKYIITVHIVDKANKEQTNNNNHRDTGSRLSLVVLQCDGGKREGTIENRENLEQFEDLLKLEECDYAQTFTTDGKGLNIMTGLGGTSGTHNCAFGECYKVTFIYVVDCCRQINCIIILFILLHSNPN